MTPSPHHREVVTVADAEDLADRAADWMVNQLGGAGQERVSMCLAGGSTPKRLYQRMAREPWRSALPWSRFNWFWGDERVVSPDDPRSNGSMAIDALLAHVPASTTQMHLVPTGLEDPAACARAYEASLKRYYGSDRLDPARPLFDIVLLGIGPDGHTASLFPEHAAVEETTRWVVSTEAGLEPFVPRVTLTIPAIASSRAVVFLVSGADKRVALARIFAGEDLPAARVAAATSTLWFVDQAALGKS